MSSGLRIAGEVFWGTNGGIEVYLETLADLSDARFGPGDQLSGSLRAEREGFYGGQVVPLDPILDSAERRSRFLELMALAADQLERGGTFTDYGKRWSAWFSVAVRAWIAKTWSDEHPDPGGHADESSDGT